MYKLIKNAIKAYERKKRYDKALIMADKAEFTYSFCKLYKKMEKTYVGNIIKINYIESSPEESMRQWDTCADKITENNYYKPLLLSFHKKYLDILEKYL